MNKKSLWKLILILAIPCIIGFMPAPAGLSELAWVLFGIYLAAIVGLVIKPFPEPVVLLIAVAASMVVVGNLSGGEFKTTAVLSGYSSGTTWLVFSAFTLSAAFVTTGLGKRIAYLLIGKLVALPWVWVTLRYFSIWYWLRQHRLTPRVRAASCYRSSTAWQWLWDQNRKKSASCWTLPDDVHLHGH